MQKDNYYFVKGGGLMASTLGAGAEKRLEDLVRSKVRGDELTEGEEKDLKFLLHEARPEVSGKLLQLLKSAPN